MPVEKPRKAPEIERAGVKALQLFEVEQGNRSTAVSDGGRASFAEVG
jgi:hypothetical protein